jgi:hypothetical protein
VQQKQLHCVLPGGRELANVLRGYKHWRDEFTAAEEVPEGVVRKMNTMMLAVWVHWETRLDQQRPRTGGRISDEDAKRPSFNNPKYRSKHVDKYAYTRVTSSGKHS